MINRYIRFILLTVLVTAAVISSHIIYLKISTQDYWPSAKMSGAGFWQNKQTVEIAADDDPIPAQLPGPLDVWAGGTQKEIVIKSRLCGPARLELLFFDSHESAPPSLGISLNGETLATTQVFAGAGVPQGEWRSKGKPSTISLPLPWNKFMGENATISIRSVSGSWVAIKQISIERTSAPLEKTAALIFWVIAVFGYTGYVTKKRLWRQQLSLVRKFAIKLRSRAEANLRSPWRAFLITFLVITTVFAITREFIVPFNASDTRKTALLAGDEPEYLLAAYSMGHDGDLNLYNNVINKDTILFLGHPGFVSLGHGNFGYFKQVSPYMKNRSSKGWERTLLLVHRPGVSVLIAPATWSIKRMRWWAYFIVSVFGALTISAAAFFAVSAGAPGIPVFLISASLAVSPPALYYSCQAFPELPAAATLTLALALMLFGRGAAIYAACVLITLSPWFTDRAIPAAAVLAAGVIFLARSNRERAALGAIFMAGAMALAHYYYNRFGVPFPMHHSPRHKLSFTYIPLGLLRAFLDAGRGALWQVPAFALAPAAFYFWWRSGERRPMALVSAAAMILSFLLVGAFPDWTGGMAPAGRYFVIVQLMLIPLFILWINAGMTPLQKALLALALFFGLAQSLLLFNHPNWWYRSYHALFAYPSIQPLYGWLPDLSGADRGEILKSLAWGGAFFAYGALAFYRGRPGGHLRAEQG